MKIITAACLILALSIPLSASADWRFECRKNNGQWGHVTVDGRFPSMLKACQALYMNRNNPYKVKPNNSGERFSRDYMNNGKYKCKGCN